MYERGLNDSIDNIICYFSAQIRFKDWITLKSAARLFASAELALLDEAATRQAKIPPIDLNIVTSSFWQKGADCQTLICCKQQPGKAGGYHEHQPTKRSTIQQVLPEAPEVPEAQWIAAKNH